MNFLLLSLVTLFTLKCVTYIFNFKLSNTFKILIWVILCFFSTSVINFVSLLWLVSPKIVIFMLYFSIFLHIIFLYVFVFFSIFTCCY